MTAGYTQRIAQELVDNGHAVERVHLLRSDKSEQQAVARARSRIANTARRLGVTVRTEQDSDQHGLYVKGTLVALADDETEYVILAGGREVTSPDSGGALAAARQLIIDATAKGSSSRLMRKEVIILKDGIYNGRLTEAARSGRSSCE